MSTQGLVREQLPRLRSEADRAALLANLICEAFGNFMGVVAESAPTTPLQQLQAAFGTGPIPVGELIAAGLGGARCISARQTLLTLQPCWRRKHVAAAVQRLPLLCGLRHAARRRLAETAAVLA